MEDEVKDHALKAIQILKDKETNIWHKLREIALEICTIVFAITLSIWLHDLSEHNHQQKEVKAFLIGLKQDLKSDIKEMQNDEDTYKITGVAFKYFITPGPAFKLNMDSIRKYQALIFNTTGLVSHNGRYEGFKSSGKLGDIENTELQNDITDLYQGLIPTLIVTTDRYTKHKELLLEYMMKNLKRTPDGKQDILGALSTDEAKNIFLSLFYTGEITDRYRQAIEKSQKIIKEIDADYPEH